MRDHAVDLAFGVVAAGWLYLVLAITRGFSFWSDDLFLIEQAGTWRGLIEPYNDHLSLVILGIYRSAAELGGLSYTPFVIAGALSLLAVPVSYYATTRRQLGPLLAAMLAMLLLWYPNANLRSSSLNHYLVLVGGIACAAALNRGRRADWVLLAGLVLALTSAGGGIVVAGACGLHNLIARAHLRRWIVVAVPSTLWVAWRVAFADDIRESIGDATFGQAARAVRDLVLAPFYDAGLDVRLVAYLLVIAFLAVGVVRLRAGLRASANYLAWSAASVAWAMGLVQSRGAGVDNGPFRYVYVSMCFALLALVPEKPSRSSSAVQRPLLAVVILAFGLARGLAVAGDMRDFADAHVQRGREAEGTMLVLALEPDAIPDDAPVSFFSVLGAYGTAGELRTIMERYDSSPPSGPVDQQLVDRGIVDATLGGQRTGACVELTAPVSAVGVADHAFGVRPGPPMRLWSAEPFSVEVRRYGSDWIEVTEVPAGRELVLTLPALNDDAPWEVRASGACLG